MIKVTLKDGFVKEFEEGVSALEIAKSLSQKVYKEALVAVVDGKTVDLNTKLFKDSNVNILGFDSNEGKHAYSHTTSHILAQAVKKLFPDALLTIGPAIENGFYYDFDMKETLTPDILHKIEAEMSEIIKNNYELKRFELPREEAIKLMTEKGETYKVELINDLPEGEVISFYSQGDFVDLCAGPHITETGKIKAFKLLSVAGAYWRGNEKNKMLQRIYGISFPKKSMLDEYIAMVEEAKKRDHNKLGRELELFTTSDVIGQGLPLLMPKGARVVQILQRFVEDEEEKRGYVLTKTPFMAKSDLYKLSGHWDHYKDGMFVLGDEEKDSEVLALRPMTCPFQFTIYNASQKSYRDLPIRYGETSTLFRNEASGEMHGLIRVRQFTISEGHLVCMPEQVEEEFRGVVDLAKYMLNILGLEEGVSYRFSKWDPKNKEKYIDDPEAWERTQNQMKKILDHIGIDYVEADDEAAFYGPKLDIQYKNVHGKEDTIITVQIDFALGERLDMTYIDKDGQKKRPIIIHRTSLGCYERTLAMLIERYAGAFPLWMAPIQVKLLTVTDRANEYAVKLMNTLKENGLRVELDDRNEKIGYKIRQATMEKVPYQIILGDKEVENNMLSVRGRKNGDMGSMNCEEFIAILQKEIKNKEK